MTKINPNDYMLELHGKKYLPVAPRIVMMREQHPDWQVFTEPVQFGELPPMVKAKLYDASGKLIATAHKTIKSFRGFDFEKAETGAIGRALSIAGFGTLDAGDMDEGEQIADSPQATTNGTKPKPKQPNKTQTAGFHAVGKERYGDAWDDKRPDLIAAVTRGRGTSTSDLTADEMARLTRGMRDG